jgi:hypothetical protein
VSFAHLQDLPGHRRVHISTRDTAAVRKHLIKAAKKIAELEGRRPERAALRGAANPAIEIARTIAAATVEQVAQAMRERSSRQAPLTPDFGH